VNRKKTQFPPGKDVLNPKKESENPAVKRGLSGIGKGVVHTGGEGKSAGSGGPEGLKAFGASGERGGRNVPC